MKMLDDFKYTPEFRNRNVEILQAYFKAMGIKIKTYGNKMMIPIETGEIHSFDNDDVYFIGTDTEYNEYLIKKQLHDKYKNDVCFVGTIEEYEELIEKEYQEIRYGKEEPKTE